MLTRLTDIALPSHAGSGGFDHAAVHTTRSELFVAHTANDALDVIDIAKDRYLRSIPGLTGVAGALAAVDRNLVFTSNRGENTVGIFRPGAEDYIARVNVGIKPNGLAYDRDHNLLLAAHVGDPALAGSFTVALVDVDRLTVTATLEVPGRTRWAVYDPNTRLFYINIADPACIVVVDPAAPARLVKEFPIPAAGPHGLDIDSQRGVLYCACDGKELVMLDANTGAVKGQLPLGGPPDVIFLNRHLRRLYVASGDPGTLEVFDVAAWQHIETIPTEPGAHTIGLDEVRRKIYVFEPRSCRAVVYLDH